MRDPYTTLGVSKTASADEVKKAFRRMAKKYHPDQSKDPKAKDRFAEVNQAYEIVGDETKRGQFDRGEIDAEGKPRYQGFEGFGGGGRRAGPGGFDFSEAGASPFGRGFGSQQGTVDPSDFFADLFGSRQRASAGRAAPAKGEDVKASVTVTLHEAVHGGQARVTLPSGRMLEIKIPAGIEDGKQIRLKGQGQPSPGGGTPGDALISVQIAKHKLFTVDGRDLRVELPVTLYEAVLGAKVNVPTLDGMIELSIPAGARAGRTLRLRGKGLPAANGQPAGDLLITPRIALPEQSDADLDELMQRWRDEKPYNPRSSFEG